LFKETKEIVALFGGSFDPPHFGHKKVIETALEELEIDKLIIIPAFLNPFKKSSFLSPKKRLELSKEMFGEFNKVIVSDYEISQNQSIKTQQTLKYFQSLYIVKYFIIGADNLKNIDKWYNFKWLNTQVTWAIATRGGYKLDTSKLKKFKILNVDADISSTQIRNSKGK
jgi:nicotinate-nucleotide adenylyltransferase